MIRVAAGTKMPKRSLGLDLLKGIDEGLALLSWMLTGVEADADSGSAHDSSRLTPPTAAGTAAPRAWPAGPQAGRDARAQRRQAAASQGSSRGGR